MFERIIIHIILYTHNILDKLMANNYSFNWVELDSKMLTKNGLTCVNLT